MTFKKFVERFATATIEELVFAVNSQVGNQGWVTARAHHDIALRAELLRRDLDCSSFITAAGISFREPVRLDGRCIIQDPSINLYADRGEGSEEDTVLIGKVDSCDNGRCLVAIRFGEALALQTLYHAIEAANTWQDFRYACGNRNWHFIRDRFLSIELGAPADEEPFDPLLIPGYADGDWPVCPQSNCFSWLPEPVIALGVEHVTSTGNRLLEFDAKSENDLTQSLEANGFLVIREDVLCSKACGLS
ncbi:hypothetical protein CA51_13420 [Rosistilla oblonga]|uniref:hypothetical protein n=1 Tax=Rosistilla oblonga TaxID=2527990 RepID=UPI001187BF3D|nr:hypothetical protein [Rosistilla oblonga]QDV11478.1 hypothetical protein CA51_13420 [Rosistilla oblonga]